MLPFLTFTIAELYVLKIKQVDFLISKNQTLQILYLKHITLHKLTWIETHENLISTKVNIYTVQFYYYITIVNKTYLIIGQQVLSIDIEPVWLYI